MLTRNFKKATKLYLESISTFSSNELMDFNQFVFYTIILSMYSLERPQLKLEVVDCSEVLTVIRELPGIAEFLNSLYGCQYKTFLISLADTTDKMKIDKCLSSHSNFYSREMRILAYSQFLESYKSIQIEEMAKEFGLSIDFLDNELSRFISSGRLHCKIDKVG